MPQFLKGLTPIKSVMFALALCLGACHYFLTLVLTITPAFNWLESDLLYILILCFGCAYCLALIGFCFDTSMYRSWEKIVDSVTHITLQVTIIGLCLLITHWYAEPFNLIPFNLRCVLTGIAIAGFGICLYSPIKRFIASGRA